MNPQQNHSRPRLQPPGPTRLAVVSPATGAGAEPLKCVWSGYPRYERDCRSRIPMSVVERAWRREKQLEGTVEGFFYFEWRNGVWLGFGLPDGGVRGVYCPTHCSERDSREVRVEDRRTDQPTGAALQ